MSISESGPASGFIDRLGASAEARHQMLNTIGQVYQLYGYERLETPAVERAETLVGTGGAETDKLIYMVQDPSGEHPYALRFDLTVPLARFVAQNQGELNMPFSRYQVGDVYRAESASMVKGRYRAFTQCDADRVGASGALSDAEVVLMMSDVMGALEVPSIIHVNDRRILDGLAETSGLSEEDGMDIVSIIDKADKVGDDAVLSEIQSKHGDRAADLAEQYLSIGGNPEEVVRGLRAILGTSEKAQAGINHLENVFHLIADNSNPTSEIIFDPRIARGLSYYTSVIYETTVPSLPNLGSVCSGGRYDKLVQKLGGPDLPAVGTSVGVDRLVSGLQELRGDDMGNPVEAYITVMDPQISLHLAQSLRRAGIPTILGMEDKRLRAQMKDANRRGVPHTIICGTDEAAQGVVKIKNMETGDEQVVDMNDFVNQVLASKL